MFTDILNFFYNTLIELFKFFIKEKIMKKIFCCLFSSIFVINSAISAECLDFETSKKVYDEIFKDPTTIAVYCEKNSNEIETCMVFNEPSLIITFKRVKITVDNTENFTLCLISSINISNGNIIYKKKYEEKERNEGDQAGSF